MLTPAPLPPTRHIRGVLKGGSSTVVFPEVRQFMNAGKVLEKVMAESQSPWEDTLSVTSTSSYYHISVFLQDYVRIVIKIENGDGV